MPASGWSAPDTGSLQGDVSAHLRKMAARIQGPACPSILPSIIDAAERDQELAQVQARLQGAIKEPLLIAIERAKDRGELAGREDASEIVTSFLRPLVYRRWFSREPIDERFVKATVANLLHRVRKKR
ncbi:MAG TPA: TetR-like C-terminal domain-containing protein [Gammaproteobacteria bacterium]|nr:TetR-like C-terminal domain-containing protein [Gammaproteobacteria bacterium]